MPEPRSSYWFHAKRYGWGWGLPARREGWIVLISWFVFLLAAAIFLMPRSPLLFYLAIAVVSVILFAICYAKGEPLKWRWGNS